MKITVHAATVEHKHGTNFYMEPTQDALIKRVADFAREWAGAESVVLTSADDDHEVVEEYFDQVLDEFITYHSGDLELSSDTDSITPPKRWLWDWSKSWNAAWILDEDGSTVLKPCLTEDDAKELCRLHNQAIGRSDA